MTDYQSQEEHDHFEYGEETMLGEQSIETEKWEKKIRVDERQRVIGEINKLPVEKRWFQPGGVNERQYLLAISRYYLRKSDVFYVLNQMKGGE